jgi:hypothetical protein
MICAIHQPQYLPWLGYFDKIVQADIFVILDDVQFKKNEWQNRNRIRTASPDGWQWLTVPVHHRFGQRINEVRLNAAVDWQAQHLRALELNYKRAPFFAEIMTRLSPLYTHPWEDLGTLNTACVRALAAMMDITTPLVLASAMGITTERTQRLVDICHALNADTYLAGAGASDYMDLSFFTQAGIRVNVQQYVHPVYPQRWSFGEKGFIPQLSVVDLLFNTGEGYSRNLLRAEGTPSIIPDNGQHP